MVVESVLPLVFVCLRPATELFWFILTALTVLSKSKSMLMLLSICGVFLLQLISNKKGLLSGQYTWRFAAIALLGLE